MPNMPGEGLWPRQGVIETMRAEYDLAAPAPLSDPDDGDDIRGAQCARAINDVAHAA